MTTYFNTARGIARTFTETRARKDFEAGIKCDPSRYGARPGSQWESWYVEAYRKAEESKQ